MTHFIKQGNTFRAADEAMLDVHPQLPVGNYTIKMDEHRQFYIEQVDSFELNYKIYGDTLRNADRIMNSFHDRPNSTGVLLTGEKGSGKTMLAKMLSMKCAEMGIPTIIINTPWTGESFNTLVQSIEQPCMILFDEFEKVYEPKDQPAILTLLDGVFPSKKLFVLTCNDKWRIDEHMRNRPGRIFYLIDFRGLDIEFIKEYCRDKLDDQTQIDNVCRVSSMFAEFNFDLLKALCEEMNRYKETAQEAIKLLNAKPQNNDGGKFKISLKVNGTTVPEDQTYPALWRGNPVATEKFNISMVAPGEGGPDDEEDDWDEPQVTSAEGEAIGGTVAFKRQLHRFSYLDLKKVDPETGTFIYTNEAGATVTFTRIKEAYSYYHAAF